ncbi:cystathionine beta-synthase-like [Eurosta solidaginis]|uniref:cystathionine beta-synthase-like n=1 Tax=Eurosta solidaginis TaxID=178769 RepID=UPI0035311004
MAADKHERAHYFVDPALPSNCTWHLGTKEKFPHTYRPMPQRQKLTPNILEAIGCTPLVRLNVIPQSEGIKCEMYAKCEYLNPGGSVKDRIGYRMIQEAEQKGKLKPGYTVIVPTSGNTGIAIAMAAAVRGYRCISLLPDKMSNEKISSLRTLGAEILRTRDDIPYDSPEGLIGWAQRLERELPNAIVMDQFRDPANPLAHYDGTGEEILWQTDGKVDMVVMCAGTCGTLSGVGRKIKEKVPNCKIIAADPYGSTVARPVELNESDVDFIEVEGIGYVFTSTVNDYNIVDKWVKMYDKDIFNMSRRLNKEEGLLCGGSSGAAMYAALEAAKELKDDQRCVVILPDSIRNYLTKCVSDNWMEARDFKPVVNEHNHWWWNTPLSALRFKAPLVLKSDVSFAKAIEALQERNAEHLALVDADDGTLLGAVIQDRLINQMVSLNRPHDNPIIDAVNRRAIRLPSNAILGKLARILEADACVLIVDTEAGKEVIKAIATKLDVLSFISKVGTQSK